MSVILVVDDEALFRLSIRDALEAADPGLQVIEAADGVEALEAFDDHRIDLLITDVRMPRLDGVGLLAELSRRESFVPTFVVSAHGGPKLRHLAQSFGTLSFIDKPLDLGGLVHRTLARLREKPSETLRRVSLAGFLQLLLIEKRTCSIHIVSGARSGSFAMVAGEVVDAASQKLRGDEAALEIVRWPSPTFHVEPLSDLVEESVKMPFTHILMEAARLHDEGDEIGEAYEPSGSWITPTSTFPSQTKNNERNTMSNINECVAEAMALEGALAAALVDFESGLTLGSASNTSSFDIEVAASGNTQVVRAKMLVMNQLGLQGSIEDILITLDTQCHLIRPLSSAPTLFFYVAIDRRRGNLGLARHRLKSIEAKIVV